MSNQERAERGRKTLEFYNRLQGSDPDEPQDLIADLLHYIASSTKAEYPVIEAERILYSGLSHFYEESEV